MGQKENPEDGYPAQKARQGEVILRTRWRRIVFFGGLIGVVVVVFVLQVCARTG